MKHRINQHKHLFILSLLALVFAFTSAPEAAAQRRKESNDDRRREWIAEMRNFKHDFFKQELGLTREQETPFFKAYDAMDDELLRVGEETRALERKINNDANASETEMESAARTLFEQKRKEGEIELKYFEEFNKILTKKQLLKLKETERRFNRALITHSHDRQAATK